MDRNGVRGSGFRELKQRELGPSEPVAFARRLGGSEAFLKRLDLYGELDGHGGRVNTIHFNHSGEILVSGSDDNRVIFWDWAAKSESLSYDSGHEDSIYQAQIMPFTDDRVVITCAADGQVRVGQVLEDGTVDTKQLGTHNECAHKLAIEPGSPHLFYSCGEDGIVQHFDLRRNFATKLFTCNSFVDKSVVPLYVMVIDPGNPNYFTVGGLDEYARVYDIRKFQLDASSASVQPVNVFCPRHLVNTLFGHHITGLAYSHSSELLVSYFYDVVYLFQKDMGIGNPTKPQVYSDHRNLQVIKGVTFFGPNDEFVASGSDCGHVFIWRKKGTQLLHLLEGELVKCIEPHPSAPFLATTGLKETNTKVWLPTSSRLIPLPKNVEEIRESNRLARLNDSWQRLPGYLEHRTRMNVLLRSVSLQSYEKTMNSDAMELQLPASEECREDEEEGGFVDSDRKPDDGSPTDDEGEGWDLVTVSESDDGKS